MGFPSTGNGTSLPNKLSDHKMESDKVLKWLLERQQQQIANKQQQMMRELVTQQQDQQERLGQQMALLRPGGSPATNPTGSNGSALPRSLPLRFT